MKDQKASFDLFEVANHPIDMKVRFDLDKVEQEIETIATDQTNKLILMMMGKWRDLQQI